MKSLPYPPLPWTPAERTTAGRRVLRVHSSNGRTVMTIDLPSDDDLSTIVVRELSAAVGRVNRKAGDLRRD